MATVGQSVKPARLHARSATAQGLARNIRSDERVLVVGKTGSGKTYFTQHMLAGFPRLVVLDPKGRIDSAAWALRPYDDGIADLRAARTDQGGDPERVRLRVPPQLDEADWEPYFWEVYGIGNCIVYIDELYGVGPAKGSRGLQALYTRGRELGIGVWAASQRPAFIPLYVRSESDWYVIFRLQLDDDRDRLAQVIGKKAYTPLYEHQFLVYNEAMPEPVLYDRLTVKSRSTKG